MSSDTNPVRARFSPSPTGIPHVGLARTALFNWAFARHNKGKLVFRIEDTDAASDSQASYDNFERDLTAYQRAAFRAAGREPVLRLRRSAEDITFTDLVRGEITFKTGSVPDPVLVRANGDPLYTLSYPVDDALMRITHVLR